MTNQYHENNQIDEMLKLLDNGLNIFSIRYEQCQRVQDELQHAIDGVLNIVKKHDPEGVIE